MHISSLLFAARFVALALVSTALPALAAGYTQKAGSWWGDPAVPAPNHVEMTIEGVQPDATVSGTISFTLTCKLPLPSTLKVDTIVIQVDGNNVQWYSGSIARTILGQPRTFSVDTTKFSDGWHELRARCYAMETTVGPELGKQTQVTNGHQLYFKNGNAFVDNRAVTPGIVDAHSWYDTDAATGDKIDYVYVQIVNVHPLIEAPLKGVVPVTGLVTNAGPTTIAHWALKVDGVEVTEFHDAKQLRTVNFDTRTVSNGPHVVQFHGHGLAKSGRQLAGQVEIPIVVQNDLQSPPSPPSPDAGVPDNGSVTPTPVPPANPPVLAASSGCSSSGSSPLAALGAVVAVLAFTARTRRRQISRS